MNMEWFGITLILLILFVFWTVLIWAREIANRRRHKRFMAIMKKDKENQDKIEYHFDRKEFEQVGWYIDVSKLIHIELENHIHGD